MRYLPWKMLFHSISHLVLPMLNGASNPAGPRARPLPLVLFIYSSFVVINYVIFLLKKLSIMMEVLFLVRCVCLRCLDVNKSWGTDALILRQHLPFMSIKSFVQAQHKDRWQEIVSLCSLILFNWRVCWPRPRVPLFLLGLKVLLSPMWPQREAVNSLSRTWG